MLTLQRFSGINNVLPQERLQPDRKTGTTPLSEAMNVDVGLDRELVLREGFSELSSSCFKNVYQGPGFMLATNSGGDLVAIADGDGPGDAVVLYPSLGVARVWYSNWPDGRVTFSNGSINGLARADAATGWGIPIPGNTGSVTPVSGSLKAGDYRLGVSYVRLSDGLEGGLAYTAPITLGAGSGLTITALPTLAGYKMRVYLSSHFGAAYYKAGDTASSVFAFAGANKDLVKPASTEFIQAAPVGTLSAFWRGRSLVALGNLLLPSKSARPEHFDPAEHKRFSADITLVQPVQAGIFVGTTDELAYLSGETWNDLAFRSLIKGPVVLGSGVTVPGTRLKRADGLAGDGDCMLGIVGGHLVAGYQDGSAAVLTQDRYTSVAGEVSATYRVRSGQIPQYIAIPQ